MRGKAFAAFALAMWILSAAPNAMAAPLTASERRLEINDAELTSGNLAAFDFLAPSSMQWVSLAANKATAAREIQLSLGIAGQPSIKIKLTRQPVAANAPLAVYESTAIVNLPPGRYFFASDQKALTLSIATTPWVTAHSAYELVPVTESRQFGFVQDMLGDLDLIAQEVRAYFATERASRKPGSAVTHELWDAGVLPGGLRGTSNGGDVRGVQFGGFFAGDIKSLWLQMRGLPPFTCKSVLRHLLDRSGNRSAPFDYIYINEHDGYANILAKPRAGMSEAAFLDKHCDMPANVLTFGIPL